MVGRLPVPLASIAQRLRRLAGARPVSSASNPPHKAPPQPESLPPSEEKSEGEERMEAYRQVQNLDFMTAAKILFAVPPKRKKFGLDFHLVQFFFACMPSLAVYLVAMYARHEIKRMEAEVEEKKKKAEEEEKAKKAELGIDDEGSDKVLAKVKDRLDALEEVVKEIVDEKKSLPSSSSKDKEINREKLIAPAEKKNDRQIPLKTEQENSSSKLKSSGYESASTLDDNLSKAKIQTKESASESKK